MDDENGAQAMEIDATHSTTPSTTTILKTSLSPQPITSPPTSATTTATPVYYNHLHQQQLHQYPPAGYVNVTNPYAPPPSAHQQHHIVDPYYYYRQSHLGYPYSAAPSSATHHTASTLTPPGGISAGYPSPLPPGSHHLHSSTQPTAATTPTKPSIHPPIVRDLFKVWVGNIPQEATEDELRFIFKPHGKIESIKIADHCAFIQYSDTLHAQSAIRHLNGSMIKANKIKVAFASKKPLKPKGLLSPPPVLTPPGAVLIPTTSTATTITSPTGPKETPEEGEHIEVPPPPPPSSTSTNNDSIKPPQPIITTPSNVITKAKSPPPPPPSSPPPVSPPPPPPPPIDEGLEEPKANVVVKVEEVQPPPPPPSIPPSNIITPPPRDIPPGRDYDYYNPPPPHPSYYRDRERERERERERDIRDRDIYRDRDYYNPPPPSHPYYRDRERERERERDREREYERDYYYHHPPPPPVHQVHPPPPPPLSSSSSSVSSTTIAATTTSQLTSPPPPPPPSTATSTNAQPPNLESPFQGESDPFVNRKLFLGYIGNETAEELKQKFLKFGDIEDVILTQKGFAFVRFYKTESAIVAKRELGWKHKIQYDKREAPLMYPLPLQVHQIPPEFSKIFKINPTTETLSPEELHQFTSLLENLKSTQDSIKESKDWILLHWKSGKSIIQHLSHYLTQLEPESTSSSASATTATTTSTAQSTTSTKISHRISLLYLINDLVYFGLVRRKSLDQIDVVCDLIEPHLKTIFSSFQRESFNDQKIALNIIDIWDTKRCYPPKILQPLRLLLIPITGGSGRSNSNLVIHSERNLQDLKEPKGEPETLWGRLRGGMGDRVQFSKPTELLEKLQTLKRKDADKSGTSVITDTVVPKKHKSGQHSSGHHHNQHHQNIDILSATDTFQGIYRPKTKETRDVYESIMTFVQGYIGDQPLEIIKGAVEEILAILKDDSMRAPDRKVEISKLLKGMTEERFAELTNLGRMITDYKDSKSRAPSLGTDDQDDTTEGVAVVIDEEEDQEDLSDFEIKDIDDDDDDDAIILEKETEGNGGEKGDKEMANEENDHGVDNEDLLIKSDLTSRSSLLDEDHRRHHHDSSKINPIEIDAHWIQRKISTFEKDAMVSQRLAEEVLEILKHSERCENDLVTLFDTPNFEFIKLLLNNREIILYCTLLAKAENDQERKKIEDEMSIDPNLSLILKRIKGGFEQPSSTSGNSKSTSAKGKQQQSKQSQNGTNSTTATTTTTNRVPKKVLNLDELSFQQGNHLMTNKNFQFPKGSKREQYKGYEEIHVPARLNPPFSDSERLIEIAELPEWARIPFKGFEKLNRIQSRLFEWAFKTNDNLLLSAPTSAGKTNVAMLTILHEIGLHIHNGVLDRDSFKIVYIAPMKSLVQEMVSNFSNRLSEYGIVVNELTGDQSLTNKQISETQIIVTTPEKWDIITRKSGDRAYTQLVRLVIIDEIHLLHDERGPVLECIVARTLRMIESTQEMVRLVGLSATLPNYEDVATFLRVKPEGVFYFDSSYRPIPLEQQYIGISDRGVKQLQTLNDVTYKKVAERAGVNQILIFVHSRRETSKTGRDIRDRAIEDDIVGRLIKDIGTREILKEETANTAKNAELKDLLPYGIGIHHAGLARSDRSLVEELFADQHIQVLISTATLAWGVNLPAHTVIIKGTQVYNPEKGWTELSPLDVTQMLGRAGRPPYDKEGEGIVITTQQELQFYLSLINTQLSIESQFISRLADNLNAEIVLGTIQTVKDAITWLGYTYLYICMLRNPPLYDISYDEIEHDPELEQRRIDLVHSAATLLEKNNLIKYDRKSGKFQTTDLGKVASHYYITNASMSVYHEHLKPTMSEIEFFRLFSLSSEFKNVVVREGEKTELEKLLERVPVPVKETVDEPAAKINVLLQAYISNLKLDGFALIVDMFYIAQSASRITRALFEIVLKKGWAQLAKKILMVCKMIDRKMWASQSPLRQFKEITPKILNQLERRSIPIEDLYDYNSQQLGTAIQNPADGKKLFKLIHQFPKLELSAHVQPILSGLLRVDLTITSDFEFDERYHDNSIGWWIIVEDVDGEKILYYEYFNLKKKMIQEDQIVSFTVPLSDPLPPQYYVRVLADRWIGAEYNLSVSFRHLILPEKYPPCHGLLNRQPIQVSSLKDQRSEKIFNFKFFNTIQTHVFNSLYNTDENVLLAAPTNSGKTVCAELAVLRLFKNKESGSGAKAIYLAPVQDIASVRLRDWQYKFGKLYGLVVSELTGEPITDNKILERSDIIIATSEKWDILSRRWKQRKSLQSINLFIIDELHLIGGTYGPTLEIVVSRMRYISAQTGNPIRFVALSSSIANARDLLLWIGANHKNCFNFHPDVRPVPLEIQIQGFDFPHFNARMLAMTKPTIYAVSHNRSGQSLVFVPTRKLARSLAKDIIVMVDSEEDVNTKRYLKCSESELSVHLAKIDSVALKESLQWGVGFYHEGLTDVEKRVVEFLFKLGHIQVLIATHSVCWSLDVYAPLVVIMGTQLYQGKSVRYVDYPINDVLQMMGRAGKQGSDGNGKCIIYCHTPKKEYYKMFLTEPLPVESHLDHCLPDHFNSEIVTKTIVKKQDALDYLTWTFLYRRFNQNPNYYNLTGVSHLHLSEHMSELVENALVDLEQANCISIQEEEDTVSPLNLGIIASYYYLKYQTIELFGSSLKVSTKRKGILEILSTSPEFNTLPIRHREEQILQKMAAHLPLKIEKTDYSEVSTKVNVLLQSYFSRKPISADLHQDQKFILENATRLLQAIVDVLSSNSWLNPAIAAMELSQMCTQAIWDNDSVLKQLPHFTQERIDRCTKAGVESIFDLMALEDSSREKLLSMSKDEMEDVISVCMRYPDIDISYQVEDEEEIHAGGSVTVEVIVQREIDDENISDAINVVHSPYYPKEKIGGWWVIIGDPKTNHLYAIKKFTLTKKAKLKLEFTAPSVGKHSFTLYLMSDSYSGCDQEYEIELDVKPALIDDEDDENVDEDDQMKE
eukprot:gene2462-3044_t